MLDHCQFILGPEVRALEAELAAFCGARHAVTCASGTDALVLVLMAKGIGPGDAVICPTFTFTATAEVVALVGATPVFADVEEATLQSRSRRACSAACATARKLGLTPKAVIPVDLFGQPADYDRITAVAEAENLFVLDDAAQAFGATYKNRRVGALAPATATSFFPAKPLGCYGDGGAVLTDDDELAQVMRSLRVHGEGTRQVRLRAHRPERPARHHPGGGADREAEDLSGRDRRRASALRGAIPRRSPMSRPCRSSRRGSTSVWAQYTIRLPAGRRDALAAALKAQGIPTAIYYPKPLHRQDAYRHFPVAEGGAPVSERLADEVISLPMHAYLDEATQDRIIAAVRRALADSRTQSSGASALRRARSGASGSLHGRSTASCPDGRYRRGTMRADA